MRKRIAISQSKAVRKSGVFDIHLFSEMILKIKNGDKEIKKAEIKKMLSFEGLIKHYEHPQTKRKLLSCAEYFDYEHEKNTSLKLVLCNYDVIIVPKGYFKRNRKKFDVFIARDQVFFESDLKCIHSTNPDTIGNRIKEGSEQATRVVLDICSNVTKSALIDGLRLGCQRNKVIIEILLFYKSEFYRLQKSKILSRQIFKTIK